MSSNRAPYSLNSERKTVRGPWTEWSVPFSTPSRLHQTFRAVLTAWKNLHADMAHKRLLHCPFYLELANTTTMSLHQPVCPWGGGGRFQPPGNSISPRLNSTVSFPSVCGQVVPPSWEKILSPRLNFTLYFPRVTQTSAPQWREGSKGVAPPPHSSSPTPLPAPRHVSS